MVKKPTFDALADYLNVSRSAVVKYMPKKKLLLQLGYWKYLELQKGVKCIDQFKCTFTALHYLLEQNDNDPDALKLSLLISNEAICRKLDSLFAGDIDKLSKYLGIDKKYVRQYKPKKKLELMILGIQKSNELKFKKLCTPTNEKKYKKLILSMLNCLN